MKDISIETSYLKGVFASCAVQLNSIFDSALHDIKHEAFRFQWFELKKKR